MGAGAAPMANVGAAAGAGSPAGATGPQPPSTQQVGQVMEKFRPLAETVKQLGQQFPEGQEEAVQIMKSLQAWMAKVAGNSQRTPEAMAPPTA